MVGARQLAQNEPVKQIRPAALDRALAALSCSGWTGKSRNPASHSRRPTPRPAARSRPVQPSSAPACGTATAPQPHHVRTRHPAIARPPRLHDHVVLLRRPINAGVVPHQRLRLGQVCLTTPRPGRTVAGAHRHALTTGLRPVAKPGTSPRPERRWYRKALPQQRARQALSRWGRGTQEKRGPKTGAGSQTGA